MKIKEKIMIELENNRAEVVWDLIVKSVNELYKEKTTNEELEISKENYFESFGIAIDNIDKNKYKYLVVEQYNLTDDFYGRIYLEGDFETIFEDYFSDCEGGYEDIMLIDLKEIKSYLIGKEVKYTKQELKQ